MYQILCARKPTFITCLQDEIHLLCRDDMHFNESTVKGFANKSYKNLFANKEVL